MIRIRLISNEADLKALYGGLFLLGWMLKSNQTSAKKLLKYFHVENFKINFKKLKRPNSLESCFLTSTFSNADWRAGLYKFGYFGSKKSCQVYDDNLHMNTISTWQANLGLLCFLHSNKGGDNVNLLNYSKRWVIVGTVGSSSERNPARHSRKAVEITYKVGTY